MTMAIRGMLAAMVTCALVTGCAPIGDAVPEEMTGDGESPILLLCLDEYPCTLDTCLQGFAGPYCTHTVKPSGSQCYVGTCSGTCYPPAIGESGETIPGNCGGCLTECLSDCDCDDLNGCTEDRCIGAVCYHTPEPYGSDCGGGADGWCNGGMCCSSEYTCYTPAAANNEWCH